MTVGIIFAIIPSVVAVILLAFLTATLVSHAYLKKLARADEMRDGIHLKLIDTFRATTEKLEAQLDGKAEGAKELSGIVSSLHSDVDKYKQHEEKSRLEKELLQKDIEKLKDENEKLSEESKKQCVQLLNAKETMKKIEEEYTKKEKQHEKAVEDYERKILELTERGTPAFINNTPSHKKEEVKSPDSDIDIKALMKENAETKKKLEEAEKKLKELSNSSHLFKNAIATAVENLNSIKDATAPEAMSEVIYENIDALISVLYNK